MEDSSTPFKDSLRRLFDAIIASSTEEDRISGCLVTNTAFELSTVNPDIAEELKQCLAGVQSLFRDRIIAAQVAGEINKKHSVNTLTAYYMTIIQGLLISSRVTRDRAAMALSAKVALSLLD